MAALTVQTAAPSGTSFTTASAAGGGDTFVNNGKTLFYINNGHSGSQTATFTAQNNITIDGQSLAVEDLAVAVPAGEAKIIGPFPPQIFNNSSGAVAVTYSGVTSLTVRPLSMP